MIYLDNAATTLKKPKAVKRAMMKAFDLASNAGRGGYDGANIAGEYIFTAREKAAELFGVEDCSNVIFSYNATHALNMAIKGIARKNTHCVVSGYEHNSVTRPVTALAKDGVTYSVARGKLFCPQEIIENFEASIEKKTGFAVCTHVSNAFGYILPVFEIDELCFKHGIPLIIDASQSAGNIDIKMNRLKATVCICAPGHKGLYGPQGTGVLICRDGRELATIIEGGTGSMSNETEQPNELPDKLESGTMNVPAIAGISEGISYVLKRKPENIFEHEQMIIEYLVSELRKMQGIKLFVSEEKSLQSGVLSFSVDGVSPERISELLNSRKIAVRSGKHCAALAHETVGTELGTVRVSVSDFTLKNEVEFFIKAMFDIVKKI